MLVNVIYVHDGSLRVFICSTINPGAGRWQHYGEQDYYCYSPFER